MWCSLISCKQLHIISHSFAFLFSIISLMTNSLTHSLMAMLRVCSRCCFIIHYTSLPRTVVLSHLHISDCFAWVWSCALWHITAVIRKTFLFLLILPVSQTEREKFNDQILMRQVCNFVLYSLLTNWPSRSLQYSTCNVIVFYESILSNH